MAREIARIIKIYLLSLVVLLGCVNYSYSETLPTTPTTPTTKTNREFIKVYDRLLSKHVKMDQEKEGIKTSLVDYAAIKKDPDWVKAKNLIQQINFEAMPSRGYQLAFWINAYNFSVLSLITEKYPIKSINALSRPGVEVWDTYRFKFYGKKYTLRTIKDKIIIGQYGDARAHFALACSGLSCPDLWHSAYTGVTIRKQIEVRTRRFITNKTKGTNIKNYKGEVSEIFRIHKQDFFSGNVTRFISNYVILLNITGYLNFNWNLNSI